MTARWPGGLVLALVLALHASGTRAEPVMTLNEAVERGLVRIVGAKSAGGYSRFELEIENLSGRELLIDPYGSAFEPPAGTRTQRIGIGLPIKVGRQTLDLRRRGMQTNPAEEAPVGPAAVSGGPPVPPELLAGAGFALGGIALIWAWLNGLANGVGWREVASGWNEFVGRAPPEADTAAVFPTDQTDQAGQATTSLYDEHIRQTRQDLEHDRDLLDEKLAKLREAERQGVTGRIPGLEEDIRGLRKTISMKEGELSRLGEGQLRHTAEDLSHVRGDIAQSADTRALHDKWLQSKRALEALQERGRVREGVWALDSAIDELKRGETGAERRQFLEDLRNRVQAVGPLDEKGELAGLARAVGSQFKQGYEPDYTFADAAYDTALHSAAAVLDIAATKGLATASLHAADGVKCSLAAGAGIGEALGEGVREGTKSLTTTWVFGKGLKIAGWAAGKIPGVSTLVEKAARTEINLFPKSPPPAPAAGTRVWGTGMGAVREEVNAIAAAKLPADHPARLIGRINETLGKAGSEFNPRLVGPHLRLDPNSESYKQGIEALTKDPRYLTPKARAVADAVRHDLNQAAKEKALANLYRDRPELKGAITRFENTGSHAMKGSNYRGLDSDVDFTPRGNGTAAGQEAERLFADYHAKAVKELSGNRLTPGTLKTNAYGNNQGTGAFRSEAGLKVKDMMNQTSGRIDVVDGEGRITHTLRGGDPLETAPTRWTPAGGAGTDAARTQLNNLRQDLLNKYREELPGMSSPQEQLVQAAKAHKLARVFEAKTPGGRDLGVDRELYDLAKNIKTTAPNLKPEEAARLTERFLADLKGGI